MVVRAYGSANGQDVILTREEGDRWKAVVPFDEDGEYVVEFFAEDEAGNVGVMCTILFAVSHHEMRAYIVPRGYTAGQKMQQYEAFPTLEEMAAALLGRKYISGISRRGFASDVQKGGYTVEHVVCRHNRA